MTSTTRLKATLRHFAASVIVASVCAAGILGVWFPGAYADMAGGWRLVLLILGVDMVCGPLLTLVLFNPKKPRRELVQDISIVVVLQLAALTYGLHVAMQARPALTVFEADRFRVISAGEVDGSKLPEAPVGLRNLSIQGPRIIAAHIPKTGDPDHFEAITSALNGLELSFRPSYWREYDENQRQTVIKRARPLANLRSSHPEAAAAIDNEVRRIGLPETALVYLPVQGRFPEDWTALIDQRSGDIAGFVQVDGF